MLSLSIWWILMEIFLLMIFIFFIIKIQFYPIYQASLHIVTKKNLLSFRQTFNGEMEIIMNSLKNIQTLHANLQVQIIIQKHLLSQLLYSKHLQSDNFRLTLFLIKLDVQLQIGDLMTLWIYKYQWMVKIILVSSSFLLLINYKYGEYLH